jgi:hypothetical protein
MAKNIFKSIAFFATATCLIIFFKTYLYAEGSNNQSIDSVAITPVAIKMPLNKFLLVRKDSNYCALKFVKFWQGQTEQDFFAECQSYYQDNKSGDFSKTNVIARKHELSFPKPRGIGRFAFSFGNMNIRCGSIDLHWFGKGWVNFYGKNQEEGDYGIEMAPTKWTDISQVNVFDKRLTWYRYDPKRNNTEIPIDELWSESQ